MTDIVWEDPPAVESNWPPPGPGKTVLFVEALAAHPGKWAIYHKNNHGMVSYIRKVARQLGYSVEVTMRDIADDEKRRIYARVVEP